MLTESGHSGFLLMPVPTFDCRSTADITVIQTISVCDDHLEYQRAIAEYVCPALPWNNNNARTLQLCTLHLPYVALLVRYT